ncbi:MAG: hypothetical protein IKO41_21320 [Lachnospiraceae bacterium]|nr:hypothetical protein [Lachnospiraceae bacterium]
MLKTDDKVDNDSVVVREKIIKSLLTVPYDLRELVRDLENGDITRNDLVNYLSALANSLEKNTKWLYDLRSSV